MSVRDARVRVCANVYYTQAIVYTFTKLHDRRIPNVGVGVGVPVGVGPVEFQLYETAKIYLQALSKSRMNSVVQK